MPEFELQFPLEEVAVYAARTSFDDDPGLLAMGKAAGERGFYRRDEFMAVCLAKTRRVARRLEVNTSEAVESATRTALSTSDERERMAVLLALPGVSWGRASTLLHLARPDDFPILDRRAVHALGQPWPVSVSFRFWWDFVEAWRALRIRSGLPGRAFDRALWQWSSEQDVPLY
jgi:hypothetical protein